MVFLSRSGLRAAAALLVIAAASPLGTAHAIKERDDLVERPIEAAGAPARFLQRTTWDVPDAHAGAWRSFQATRGEWSAQWDADTGVPSRIFGEGVAAPGSIADAATAEAAARALLVEMLPLVAPGADAADFVLSLDAVHAGGTRRTVSFAQTWRGLPVVGARVGFLFAHDRIIVVASSAAPDLAIDVPSDRITAAAARAAAKAWIAEAHGGNPVVVDDGPATIFPLVRERSGLDPHVVVPVTVDLASPRGRWTVYIDAASGQPVARRQLLMFASGSVTYHVPERQPLGSYADFPAAFASHTVDGTLSVSDLAGLFVWASAVDATVSPGLIGPYARIIPVTGELAATSFTLAPSATQVWDSSALERDDAQLSAFVHANLVKEFVRSTLDPDLPFLDQRLNVYVNEPDICNAYSNGGDEIHFFVESTGQLCANTARLADVVYHEFGHSLHGMALLDGSFDGSFSEGISDYLAATITGDPATARGFFMSEEPLRHIDPDGYEHRWPEHLTYQVHQNGFIISGASWDLRKALIASLGDGPGAALADDLWYEMIRRADGIATGYVEVLAADDDDGNLANGTPHQCEIDAAFGAHGLTQFLGDSVAIVQPPSIDGLALTLGQPADGAHCAPPQIDTATVTWQLRSDPTVNGVVDFDVASGAATAALPAQDDGEVILYQVSATLEDGTIWTFPRNPADPWYQVYVGPVTRLFCTDFSSDPTAAGWALGGGFRWGSPISGSAGLDPTAGFTGSQVLGIDQTSGGRYDPLTSSTATMPDLDVSGYENVHLQYRRWLTVEDAVFDQASILADGAALFTNAGSGNGFLDHRDLEWRFQDVDLTPLSGNGRVQVAFKLVSNDDRELGGWTIDDVCVVASGAPVCGDDRQTLDEACDDGNTIDGDGCSSACALDEVPPPDDPGCCSTGGQGAGGGALLLVLVMLGLRRRR